MLFQADYCGGEKAAATMADSDVLWATAKLIGNECAKQNIAFYECKKEWANPEKCLAAGYNVTACATSVIRMTDGTCPEQLGKFKACLKKHDGTYGACREAQNALH
ncbi:unnamed protein product [Phaeothamnion confervicola]